MTLLFRAEMYEELITVYEGIKEPVFDSATLAIAALSKIRTKESFDQVYLLFISILKSVTFSMGGQQKPFETPLNDNLVLMSLNSKTLS